MKILITGITGFVGQYLAEYLNYVPGVQIAGTVFTEDSFNCKKKINGKVKTFKCDLRNKKSVDLVVKKFRPNAVIHLAGSSSMSNSWKDAEHTIINNTICQLNILDALKEHSPKAKVIIISSAQVYGAVKRSEIPTKENVPLKPTNPYIVSKITQESLGYQYFINFKIPVVILRPSNHIGPRQEGNFAIPSFAKQIAKIESGLLEPIIKVGNLEAKRDFSDVRDIVEAYFFAIKKCKPGEIYNVGSGKSFLMKNILQKMIKLSTKNIKIKVDKSLLRPTDIPILEVDSSKFKRHTGWKPKISLNNTLEDTLNYWRKKIKRD